jgi:hypothetical protein
VKDKGFFQVDRDEDVNYSQLGDAYNNFDLEGKKNEDTEP